jgi:hypothetical protein
MGGSWVKVTCAGPVCHWIMARYRCNQVSEPAIRAGDRAALGLSLLPGIVNIRYFGH